jgi:hypothetical protein
MGGRLGAGGRAHGDRCSGFTHTIGTFTNWIKNLAFAIRETGRRSYDI